MVQPFYTATACELDQVRSPSRVIHGLDWIPNAKEKKCCREHKALTVALIM